MFIKNLMIGDVYFCPNLCLTRAFTVLVGVSSDLWSGPIRTDSCLWRSVPPYVSLQETHQCIKVNGILLFIHGNFKATDTELPMLGYSISGTWNIRLTLILKMDRLHCHLKAAQMMLTNEVERKTIGEKNRITSYRQKSLALHSAYHMME